MPPSAPPVATSMGKWSFSLCISVYLYLNCHQVRVKYCERFYAAFSAIQHKEKSWYDYLIKNLTGARKAAEHLFRKV